MSSMTETTRKLLAGDSDKSITEVGEVNIWRALEVIEENSDDYGMGENGWRDNYVANNTEAFDKLVGNTSGGA